MLSTCAMVIALTALACKDSITPVSSDRAMSRGMQDPAMNLAAFKAEVCGVIPATLVIRENTRLSCDVQCVNATGPCIQFGNDNITLWLNGFTMSGAVSPPAGCAASPAFGPPPSPGPFPFDGISTAGFDHVRIRGPGMVQTFRRHGIFVFDTEDAIVENVTSHYNCYSGIFLGLANDNSLSENVSVRNGIASGAAPCGGNCISFSNGNRIRRNHFYGNGSVAPGAPLNSPNDFGVGLVGTSSDNIIEENSIGGNINGILLFPLTTGNLIRHNLIAGNPPVQLSATTGPPTGADIRDASAPGANTFVENHCITYEGASTPRPCPNFPKARGHY
jgi:hypothetical protein